MKVDLLASSPKYRAHLDPVWAALPDSLKGIYADNEHQLTADRARALLVAGYLDMRAGRRRQYGRIALLEHGIGQSYGSTDHDLPGGDDRDPVGLFLSPNGHAAARDQERYPKAKVVVVGSTVLDGLPRKPKRDDPPTVAVAWHWHYPRIPERGSAWEHFRGALAELADAYTVIGHAHPQAAGMVKATYEALGIEYDPDYRRVFGRADVLVADNTSALYEFASTGRPVVVLNSPAYRRDVDFGLRFWEAADVGVQVDEPEQLVAGVTEALADSSARKAARRVALAMVYAYQKGAAKRAVKALREWLGV